MSLGFRKYESDEKQLSVTDLWWYCMIVSMSTLVSDTVFIWMCCIITHPHHMIVWMSCSVLNDTNFPPVPVRMQQAHRVYVGYTLQIIFSLSSVYVKSKYHSRCQNIYNIRSLVDLTWFFIILLLSYPLCHSLFNLQRIRNREWGLWLSTIYITNHVMLLSVKSMRRYALCGFYRLSMLGVTCMHSGISSAQLCEQCLRL